MIVFHSNPDLDHSRHHFHPLRNQFISTHLLVLLPPSFPSTAESTQPARTRINAFTCTASAFISIHCGINTARKNSFQRIYLYCFRHHFHPLWNQHSPQEFQPTLIDKLTNTYTPSVQTSCAGNTAWKLPSKSKTCCCGCHN